MSSHSYQRQQNNKHLQVRTDNNLTYSDYCCMKGTGVGPFGYCAHPFAAPIGGYGAVSGNPGVDPGIADGCGYDDMWAA